MSGTLFTSIEDAVAATAQAALEDFLFFFIRIKARARSAVNCALGCAFTGTAADGARGGTHDAAERAAFGDSLADQDLLGIGLTLFPVLRKPLRIDALGVDDRIRVCSTASDEAGRDQKN